MRTHPHGRDYIPDPRDRNHPMAAPRSERRARHWRLGPVTDQVGPTCVGHAWWNWFASSPIRQRPISPLGIYRLSQQFDEWDGTGYDGTSVRGGAKALQIADKIVEYHWAFDADTAVAHVLEVGPVVLGVNWYASMDWPDLEGFMTIRRRRTTAGHALLMYGVDMRRGFASLRNSWGESWGLGGNARLALEDLELLLSEDGECCAAVEK